MTYHEMDIGSLIIRWSQLKDSLQHLYPNSGYYLDRWMIDRVEEEMRDITNILNERYNEENKSR